MMASARQKTMLLTRLNESVVELLYREWCTQTGKLSLQRALMHSPDATPYDPTEYARYHHNSFAS